MLFGLIPIHSDIIFDYRELMQYPTGIVIQETLTTAHKCVKHGPSTLLDMRLPTLQYMTEM